MNDVKRASLENARFRDRQVNRDILRAHRKQAEKEKQAKQADEIKQMHYYGHECTLSAEQLAELAERVRHRPWKATW